MQFTSQLTHKIRYKSTLPWFSTSLVSCQVCNWSATHQMIILISSSSHWKTKTKRMRSNSIFSHASQPFSLSTLKITSNCMGHSELFSIRLWKELPPRLMSVNLVHLQQLLSLISVTVADSWARLEPVLETSTHLVLVAVKSHALKRAS